jgi:hypothetical protein
MGQSAALTPLEKVLNPFAPAGHDAIAAPNQRVPAAGVTNHLAFDPRIESREAHARDHVITDLEFLFPQLELPVVAAVLLRPTVDR